MDNLYKHRSLTELFKIMKYRIPISLYMLFTRSEIRGNRLKPPKPTLNFVYKSSWLWNKYYNTDKELDFMSTSCTSFKSRLNRSLLEAQNRYFNEWHKENFEEFGPLTFDFEAFMKSNNKNNTVINQRNRRRKKINKQRSF